MRIPILTALLAAVLLCSPTRAGEDDPLAEILERLTRIEERLERIERKLAAWTPPPEVGPLSPEHRTPVDVAVFLDLQSLRVSIGPPNRGHLGLQHVTMTIEARVKLLRAAQPLRGLILSIHGGLPPGSSEGGRTWQANWTPVGEERWRLGEERKLRFRVWRQWPRSAISPRHDMEVPARRALSGQRLHLYVDLIHLEDDTSWWDTREYWVAQSARLSPGMSFEAVKEILPGYDKDVGVQAFPGKPVLRSWLLSPRWLVHVEFDKEGMTGKPVLIPVGPHTTGGSIGHGD